MLPDSSSAPASRRVRITRRGARRSTRPAAPIRTFFAALETALAQGDGELLVVGAERRGVVFVIDGRIAWVIAGGDAARLEQALGRHLGFDRAALRELVSTCLRTGQSLVECLLDDEGVSLAAVERALLEHHAEALDELARAEPHELTFQPGRRAHASTLLFEASEVVATIPHLRAAGESVAPPAPRLAAVPDVEAVVGRLMTVEGAIAAAVVDVGSGEVLGLAAGAGALDVEVAARGAAEVVRAQLAIVEAMQGAGGLEEIVLTLGSQHHLVRVVQGAPSTFLYLVTDVATGRLGLARHGLRSLDQELAA